MNVTIKSLKHVKSRSEETHCFHATIYIDGKVLCDVDNDGRGGCDFYSRAKKSPSNWQDTFNAIEKELGAEIIEGWDLPNSLEHVVCDLVNKALVEKDVKSLLKRRVVYVSGEPGIFQLPAKYKPTPENLNGIKNSSWWSDEHELLAEMSLERAIEFYQDYG